MVTFIKIGEDERNMLFKKAKENWLCTCSNLAKNIGVSRSMLFAYKKGTSLIPEKKLNYLINISHFQPKDLIKIEKQRYLKKEILHPRLNQKFAEILGALNGDGHLNDINYEVSITGNLKEEDYLLYLKKKLECFFGIEFKLWKYPHCIKVRAYSKKIVDFLHQEHNLPKGKKKDHLFIPPKILSEKKLTISYLRGLFDTDGTFYIRRKKDPVIEISSADKRFLKQVTERLQILGLACSLGESHVSIYRKEEIKRFFEVIKPANPKHLKKFNLYFN